MSVIEIAKEESTVILILIVGWRMRSLQRQNKTFKKCEWKTHTIKYSYKVM